RGAAALAAAPAAAGLCEIDIQMNKLGAEGLETLLGSPHLAGLRSLGLACMFFGQGEVDGLDRWPSRRALRRLPPPPTPRGDDASRGLAAAPVLGRLQVLDLRSSRLGPAGLGALLEALPAGRLRSLHLSGSKVGDEGARLLAGCAALSGLRDLDLSTAGIGP